MRRKARSNLAKEPLVIDEFVKESFEKELSKFSSNFKPVILNIPTRIFRGFMNRTCLALLGFLVWFGTEIDEETGEVTIRPVAVPHSFLVRYFGLSRDWISKMIYRLEKLGYLKVKKRKDSHGRYLANVYIVSENILNKEFLRAAKSGKLKLDREELDRYLKPVYFQIREGKIEFEDFVRIVSGLFEISRSVHEKITGSNCLPEKIQKQ